MSAVPRTLRSTISAFTRLRHAMVMRCRCRGPTAIRLLEAFGLARWVPALRSSAKKRCTASGTRDGAGNPPPPTKKARFRAPFQNDLDLVRRLAHRDWRRQRGHHGRLRAGDRRELRLCRCTGRQALGRRGRGGGRSRRRTAGHHEDAGADLDALNRSETSSFSMPMQPDETNLPIVEGWLVPWMR